MFICFSEHFSEEAALFQLCKNNLEIWCQTWKYFQFYQVLDTIIAIFLRAVKLFKFSG